MKVHLKPIKGNGQVNLHLKSIYGKAKLIHISPSVFSLATSQTYRAQYSLNSPAIYIKLGEYGVLLLCSCSVPFSCQEPVIWVQIPRSTELATNSPNSDIS